MAFSLLKTVSGHLTNVADLIRESGFRIPENMGDDAPRDRAAAHADARDGQETEAEKA